MSLPRYAAKRDDVEPEIVRVFQEAGWSVIPLNGKGLPDLLVGPPGGVELVECKTGNAGLSPDQRTWHKAWSGKPVHIVRSAAHARKLVRMLTVPAAATWDEAAEQAEDARVARLRSPKNEDAPA